MAEKNGGKEGFTLGLALMDAIPVVAFGIDMILLSKPLNSPLFLIGAILAFIGGGLMVLYKIILATIKKDYPICKKLFPFFMSGGWILMIISVIINRSKISIQGIWNSISAIPAAIFFILGIAFFVAFIVYFKTKFNADSARDNWIEEILNAGTQVCILIGVILSIS